MHLSVHRDTTLDVCQIQTWSYLALQTVLVIK